MKIFAHLFKKKILYLLKMYNLNFANLLKKSNQNLHLAKNILQVNFCTSFENYKMVR